VELCDRIDLRLCNKRVIESLIDSGACDSLGGERSQLVAALDHAFSEAQVRQDERFTGQHALFGDAAPAPSPQSPLPDVPPWTEQERLQREKAVLGFFISGHPLAKYRAEVELFGNRTTATLGMWTAQKVTVAAVVTVVKRKPPRRRGRNTRASRSRIFTVRRRRWYFRSWAKLNGVIRADGAYLISGGYNRPRSG